VRTLTPPSVFPKRTSGMNLTFSVASELYITDPDSQPIKGVQGRRRIFAMDNLNGNKTRPKATRRSLISDPGRDIVASCWSTSECPPARFRTHWGKRSGQYP
jgi:hypothetical protein